MIYFDNAASSFPKPESVLRGVGDWLKLNGANPGRSAHGLSLEAAEKIFETRCAVASFLGVSSPEKVVFVPSATYGLNMLILGLLKRGNHVITTDIEHNSVLRPLNYMKKYYNVKVDVAKVDFYDDNATVNNILSLLKKNTRFVVCSQCSNVCGKVLPIKLISESLPDDVKLVVDGAQAAGVVMTDISEQGIDYYCAPSHKGFMGIQGSGIVIVNNNELPKRIISGGTGGDSFNMFQPSYLPDAFESGTLPTPSILSIKYGIEYIESINIASIYEHKKKLVLYLYNLLKDLDYIRLYLDSEKAQCVGVLSFNVLDYPSEGIASYLSTKNICVRGGYHCAPLIHKRFGTTDAGSVRVSFNYFNSFDEIDVLIKEINNYKKMK